MTGLNCARIFRAKHEAAIHPEPKPDEWCKLRLVVRGAQLEAFVNGAQKPALRVELLSKRLNGKVGLWVGNNSDGWFRSCRVTTNTVAKPDSTEIERSTGSQRGVVPRLDKGTHDH